MYVLLYIGVCIIIHTHITLMDTTSGLQRKKCKLKSTSTAVFFFEKLKFRAFFFLFGQIHKHNKMMPTSDIYDAVIYDADILFSAS